jgi:hypothetical protein
MAAPEVKSVEITAPVKELVQSHYLCSCCGLFRLLVSLLPWPCVHIVASLARAHERMPVVAHCVRDRVVRIFGPWRLSKEEKKKSSVAIFRSQCEVVKLINELISAGLV